MITTPIPITLCLPEGAPRSPGIHVSGIIGCIAKESGILKKEYCEDLSLEDVSQEGWWNSLTPVDQLRIAIGLAWEEWYGRTLDGNMGVSYHPGECEIDGVYMTPDGESVDIIRHHPVRKGIAVRFVHEFKATYKSTKTVGNLESQWMWLAQTKAYCKGLNTRFAYVHVLFLCGDYKYPIQPQLKCWRVEYTQTEIDDNWELLTDYVKHRQALEEEGLA